MIYFFIYDNILKEVHYGGEKMSLQLQAVNTLEKLKNRNNIIKTRDNSDVEEELDLKQIRKNLFLKILQLIVMYLLLPYIVIKKSIFRIFGKKPNVYCALFDGFSQCKFIRENVMTWKALDYMYNYQYGINGIWVDFWFKADNVLGLKNRLKLVKKLLFEEITRLVKEGKNEINILSLACGSAQGVLEVVYYAKNIVKYPVKFKLLLVDLDKSALEYAQKMAEYLGLENEIILVNENIKRLESILEYYNFKPDIVEIVGFLDYRPNASIRRLIRRVKKYMAQNGALIVSNVNYNPEMFYIWFAVDWFLIYRTPERFKSLIEREGFRCKVFLDKTKIHIILLAKPL